MNYFLCELIKQTLACTTASKMAASLPPACEHCRLLQLTVGKHTAAVDVVEYVMEQRPRPYEFVAWLKKRVAVIPPPLLVT